MGNRVALLSLLAALAASSACASPRPLPGAASSSSSPSPSTARVTAADFLPDLPLARLDGSPSALGDVAAGRVALVSLWATWCEACAAEMDALNRLDARLGGRDAVVIGVAVGEEREKVAAFARARGLRYAQLVDEDFALSDALGQRRLPATLVVDRQGRIVFRGQALDARSLEAMQAAMHAVMEAR